METKVCRICGEGKPIEEFGRNSQYHDGRDTRCKKCRNAYVAKRCHDRKAIMGGGNFNIVDSSNEQKVNPLAQFTPRQLMKELKNRGFVWEWMDVKQRSYYKDI